MSGESLAAPTRPEVSSLVLEFTADAVDVRGSVEPSELSEQTVLVGPGAVVDSLGLVQIISDTEDALSDQYGHSLDLTDERALSQERSPFRTVGAMVDHVMTCLEVTPDR